MMRKTLISMGAIGALRSMTKAGKLDVIPVHVSQVGPLITAGVIPCDVAMIQVSPADKDGNHSFGLISDHTKAMVDAARLVIAAFTAQDGKGQTPIFQLRRVASGHMPPGKVERK